MSERTNDKRAFLENVKHIRDITPEEGFVLLSGFWLGFSIFMTVLIFTSGWWFYSLACGGLFFLAWLAFFKFLCDLGKEKGGRNDQ